MFSQKKGLQKFFSSDLKKKVFKNFFQAKKIFKIFFLGDFHLNKTKKGLRKFFARFLALSSKISTVQKIVLSSSRGQGSFRGLEASRPRPRTSKCVLQDVLEDSPLISKNFVLIYCSKSGGYFVTGDHMMGSSARNQDFAKEEGA